MPHPNRDASQRRAARLAGALVGVTVAALVVAALVVPSDTSSPSSSSSSAGAPSALPLTPPRNGTVHFLSPASPIKALYNDTARYAAHVADLVRPFGLRAKLGQHALDVDEYLAGTDEDRAADLNAAWADDSGAAAVVANRGGYGCARLLGMLDFEAAARSRLPVMGFSDLTSLLNAVHTRTGLVTFHGPMGYASHWSNTTAGYVRRVVMEGGKGVVLSNSAPGYPATTAVVPGRARGRLIGGNLSVFVSLLGSPFLPTLEQMRGRLLFLEEVGEAPYRVDRMMESLRLAGVLDAVAGVVFGQCHACEAGPGSFTWQQVLQQKLGGLGVPSFIGGMFGHDQPSMYVLPLGVEAEMDASRGTVTLLGAATSPS